MVFRNIQKRDRGGRDKKSVHRTLAVVLALAGVVVVLGSGTAAGNTAPTCSAVSYSGAGTPTDPYQVGSLDQLQCLDANHASVSSRSDALDASYELTQDIDASGTANWNGGKGFDPIGDGSSIFRGTFHGLGHTVSNLTIDRSSDEVGLFAVSSGDIEHLELANVSITGGTQVGGLVGENYGYVSNVTVTGSVTATSGTAGGLVAFNGNTFDRSIRNSSAIVSVTGSLYVGGLVAQHTRTGIVVRNSFSAGSGTGSSNDGGFAGLVLNDAVVEKSYWNTDVQSTGVGKTSVAAGGVADGQFNATGLTTAEMQGQNADQQMTALDFDGIWRTTSGYPELRHEFPPTFTSSNPSVSVDEDGSLDLTSALEVTDVSPSDTLTWTVVSAPSNGSLSGTDGESESISGTSNLFTLSSSPMYTPSADFAGGDSFDVKVADDNPGMSGTITVNVTVEAVNDRPSFSLPASPDQTVETDSQQTVTGFIDTSTFDPGPSEEADQSISDFLLSNDDNALFDTQPDIDNDGDLTFTPADGVVGTATVDVRVVDDGGTSNGGEDTSAPESFDITFDKRDCLDRREVSRGQEDRACPGEDGLRRDKSRGETDRGTGRDGDTSRRDRSRGEGRSRGSGR